MPEARKRPPAVPAKMKILVAELLNQRVYDLAAAAEKAALSTYLVHTSGVHKPIDRTVAFRTP
jgi:hypothetical protein